ncbi:hypothetical protein F5Y00DRAFT_143738 [Daldinia vernicosa]|uniref:uncharacterized protein n=1 Tax=Daldinia vernicosa TaxID=114800 RepID=UPI002007E1BC|nr:uncharacterized protein F5Y00DRAFT_143738 [Daldinia vernicosa]KAI0846528.1 hypothetical protein F5Y00DRAFT_143738 [Daldinia vernicosa]
MLRGTRSFLTRSSRAIVSPKPSVYLPSRSQNRTATITTKSSSIYPRAPIFRNIAPIQKVQYVTKTPSGFQQGRDPEVVTTESSVRHFYEPSGQEAQKPIKRAVRDDLEGVKDTFDLSSVPREPYILGLAGTLPYLATSISTVYLSWVLNTTWPTTSSFLNSILVSHDTARQLLSVIEPIQLGYGAVIISFLGAVHWGMEFTEKTPNRERTRFRYGLGVLAPIIAWPTLLMPMDFALTSQFAAFLLLYFADSRATVRAWAPSWYATYRFVLTAVVGAAIFISLIGRMKVGDAKPRLTGLDEKLHERRGEEDYTEKWENLEKQEKEKLRKEKEAEEEKKKEEGKENAKKSSSGEEEGEGGKKDEKKDDKKDDKEGEKDEDNGAEEAKQEGKKGDSK